MSVTISQMCDSCGATRDIPLESLFEGSSLTRASQAKGWCQVRPNKHLCSKCVDAAVK